jgi:hypothetical protein
MAQAVSLAGRAIQSGDQASIDRAKASLAVVRIAEQIAKIVDSAPPLSDEQREQLATVIREAMPTPQPVDASALTAHRARRAMQARARYAARKATTPSAPERRAQR